MIWNPNYAVYRFPTPFSSESHYLAPLRGGLRITLPGGATFGVNISSQCAGVGGDGVSQQMPGSVYELRGRSRSVPLGGPGGVGAVGSRLVVPREAGAAEHDPDQPRMNPGPSGAKPVETGCCCLQVRSEFRAWWSHTVETGCRCLRERLDAGWWCLGRPGRPSTTQTSPE
jgi:hypothetical protein